MSIKTNIDSSYQKEKEDPTAVNQVKTQDNS